MTFINWKQDVVNSLSSSPTATGHLCVTTQEWQEVGQVPPPAPLWGSNTGCEGGREARVQGRGTEGEGHVPHWGAVHAGLET